MDVPNRQQQRARIRVDISNSPFTSIDSKSFHRYLKAGCVVLGNYAC
ncbi:MAG: hypothetical protein IPF79_02360 [Ignavibacteria bacterium]|nr:hypothetical protein [Ignavibacteria bacterium]